MTSTQGILVGAQEDLQSHPGPQRGAHVGVPAGPNGPYMKFETEPEEAGDESTICHNIANQPILVLDRERLSHDVRQISEGEYFQKLQAAVKKLRESGPSGVDEPE